MSNNTLDYYFITLKPEYIKARETGAPTAKRLLEALDAVFPNESLQLRGIWQDQLGWDTRDAAILLGPGFRGQEEFNSILKGAIELETFKHEELEITARPLNTTILKPGGIYVHRWLYIDAGQDEKFVKLSLEGWPDLETRYDANVIALCKAHQTEADKKTNTQRMFFLTRYASHGVWQDTRYTN